MAFLAGNVAGAILRETMLRQIGSARRFDPSTGKEPPIAAGAHAGDDAALQKGRRPKNGRFWSDFFANFPPKTVGWSQIGIFPRGFPG
jgi:hypothetical protein